MTYLPYITERYQIDYKFDEIEDIYGNKIMFNIEDQHDLMYINEILFTNSNPFRVYIGSNVTAELEQLYDKLTVEVVEKVCTYGRDMEIGR